MFPNQQFNYEVWRKSGTFDSKYYYLLLEYFKLWLGTDLRTPYLKVSEKAKLNPEKFIWHLFFHTINIELNAATKTANYTINYGENNTFQIKQPEDLIKGLNSRHEIILPINIELNAATKTKQQKQNGQSQQLIF